MDKHKGGCTRCFGFGLWRDDSGQPMGPIDAQDGMPTKACPKCGANANPDVKPLSETASKEILRDILQEIGVNPLSLATRDHIVEEAEEILNVAVEKRKK